MTVTIELIRQKILDKAMRGELVEQDINDEPVKILLDRIKKEQENLIKEKVIRKQKPLPVIEDGNTPYELPDGWKWVWLGDIADFRKGPFGSSITKSMFVPKSKNTVKIYEQQNAIKKNADLGNYYITKEKFESLKRFEVHPGDIIVSCAGTIGETYVLPKMIEKGIINQALMRVKLMTGVSKSFFLYCFDALLKGQVSEKSKGSAIKNIPPIADLRKMFFPLPSIQEQNRIVEKIESLFNLCNKWENEVGKQQTYLSVLREKVLDDAMKGLLVEQDENDEPAEALLKKVEEEKRKLIKEKKIKKQKSLPPIEEDEIPYELPNGWKWARLNDLSASIDVPFADGPFGSNLKREHYVDHTEVRIIQLSNIGKEGWKDVNKRYTSYEHLKTIERSKVNIGDIVIAKMMPAGRAIIVPDIDDAYVLSSDAVKYIPHPLLNKSYLLFAINSSVVQTQVYSEVQGTTRVRTSLTKLKRYLIPVPPINEQNRVVKKIEMLRANIDELEAEMVLPK